MPPTRHNFVYLNEVKQLKSKAHLPAQFAIGGQCAMSFAL
jgi:hypothetical protein